MRKDTLLRIVEETAAKLGHEMSAAMRKIEPTHDYLSNYGNAIEQSLNLIVNWRTEFLSSLAGGAIRKALGDAGSLTIYVKQAHPGDAEIAQRLMLNGLVNGSEPSRFLFFDGRGMTPIEGRDDLMMKLPAMFLFHVCRHLASSAAARDMLADLKERVAADETATSN